MKKMMTIILQYTMADLCALEVGDPRIGNVGNGKFRNINSFVGNFNSISELPTNGWKRALIQAGALLVGNDNVLTAQQ